MKLNELSLKEAQEKLKKGEVSSQDLTESCLKQIKKLEPKIKAFITITEEQAKKQAKESDARRAKNQTKSEIDGIPIAVKDIFCTKGVKTTAGSKILEDFIPPYESTVTQKLKNAGAVILGKTNMDEFAMGSSTENSAFGPTKNPWDLARVPGGSSGGSAAAVAADMCIAALGADTGGSIRQPASLCGVFGIKPTYGRVSRYGILAYASSLDQAGPITKSAEDSAILLKIIAGKDNLDSTTVCEKVANYQEAANAENIKGLKIGVPKEFFGKGLDGKVESMIKKAIDEISKMGAEVVEISLPYVKYALPAYYIVASAEASSNLARYDGIKYGSSKLKAQSSKPKTLLDLYLETRQEGFGEAVRRRIMLGTYTLSAGYYEAYYKKAQQVRTLVKKDFDQAFKKVDLILGPVSPTPAFKIGEKVSDPLTMYLSDIYTVPVNPAGLPAASVPCGFVDGLPIGLHIIGPRLGEEKIFQLSSFYEKATGWGKKKAKIS